MKTRMRTMIMIKRLITATTTTTSSISYTTYTTHCCNSISNARLLSTTRTATIFVRNGFNAHTQPRKFPTTIFRSFYSTNLSSSDGVKSPQPSRGKTSANTATSSVPPIEMAQVEEYTNTSFTINSVQYFGSVIVFPNMVFSWDCKRFEDIKEEHFALFPLFFPNTKYLIIGSGREYKRMPDHLVEYLDKRGIVVESMTTFHALGTFNIVSEEGRAAAACLITNEPYDNKAPVVIQDKEPPKRQ